ncbi:hypothetical protein LCGC14_3132030, partial [marine sediment metagenome]
KQYRMDTLHGLLDLPADQVVGLLGVPDQAGPMRAVLVGGQIVTGKLQSTAIELKIPTGGTLKIPFGRIRQCSYRISEARPEETPLTDALIVLRNGDRLAFEADRLDCFLRTRHGRIRLQAKHLLAVHLAGQGHGVHRATFLNGSTLAGVLGPDRILLPLKLGKQLNIPREMILAIHFAAQAVENPELGRILLSNDDELIGRLVDESFQLRTAFGTVPVRPANILAMAFDRHDPKRVKIKLWNDSTLRGRLLTDVLRFAIQPGPVVKLYPGQIVSLSCPDALPPEHIIKAVQKYVAMLSVGSYKDRQEAQEKLMMMKAPIIPLLRKHLKDSDSEVRQRIRT